MNKLSLIPLLLLSNAVYADVHYCPPPDLVKKNERNVKAWKDQGLYWTIAYRGWPYADQIGFQQVFYYPNKNKLDCRYKWINPKEPGTYLWTSVELSPDANTYVVLSGNNWSKLEGSEELLGCTSGRPETCAFEIKSGKVKE
jgi:hypothetical protein